MSEQFSVWTVESAIDGIEHDLSLLRAYSKQIEKEKRPTSVVACFVREVLDVRRRTQEALAVCGLMST
jgi:hypothetical protein